MDKIKTVILCGGIGYRLKEETEFKPKPMVEIGGKPILWHIMKIYSHWGFNNFLIALGYKGNMIKDYFVNKKYYDENFPFLKDFDKVYYSWQTGFVKPDLEAYKNLLRENNLQPEQCLYFDDSVKNIEAANSLGIKSYLFKDIQDLQAILKAAALLG